MLTEFLEAIKNEVSYKHWYFGHYHEDMDIDDKHTCVYYNIIKLDGGVFSAVYQSDQPNKSSIVISDCATS